MEGGPVELDVVKNGFDALAQAYDLVTMEGSGGILCPCGWTKPANCGWRMWSRH